MYKYFKDKFLGSKYSEEVKIQKNDRTLGFIDERIYAIYENEERRQY